MMRQEGFFHLILQVFLPKKQYFRVNLTFIMK